MLPESLLQFLQDDDTVLVLIAKPPPRGFLDLALDIFDGSGVGSLGKTRIILTH